MIKIKDLIINENEIVYIEEFDAESLGIMFKGKDKATFVNAHPEDIEWNYVGQVSSQVSSQVEDTPKEDEYIELSNKYQRILNRNEELEEKIKKLKEEELRESKNIQDKIYKYKYLDRLSVTKISKLVNYTDRQVYRILKLINKNIRK